MNEHHHSFITVLEEKKNNGLDVVKHKKKSSMGSFHGGTGSAGTLGKSQEILK